MIILDATTKKLQIKLAAAGTIPFTAHWSDITTTTFVPGSADGYSAGASPATIVDAPAASTERKIQAVTIYNNSGAAATVYVELYNDTVIARMLAVTLAAGDMLLYDDVNGWKTMDPSGRLRVG